MGQDHLTVLLLKFTASSAFPIGVLSLVGSQDSGQAVQYTLCRATTAGKTLSLPTNTW